MTILPARDLKPLEGGASFSLRNRLVRATWNLTWLLLASWTPNTLNGWRVFLLRCFGAQLAGKVATVRSNRIWLPSHLIMGENATLGPRVTCYNMAPITIGERTIVSQGAHLCAGSHDVGDPDFQLIARPIVLGADVWIAAEAFVGPGVTVGDGAVLGARAVAMRSLDPWTIYSGNPAVPIRGRTRRASTAP